FPAKIFSNKVLFLIDVSDDINMRMAVPLPDMEKLLSKEKQDEAKKPEETGKKENGKERKEKEEKEEKEDTKKFVKTRLSYVTEKLMETVKSLDENTKANIITYSISVNKWLKSADNISKKDYEKLESFLNTRTMPARDIYSVLKTAFEEKEIDTIFLISCGLPQGSVVEDTDEILKWIAEENYFRCVNIHTVGILSNYEAEKLPADAVVRLNEMTDKVKNFLSDIAARNGGTFFYIDTIGKVEKEVAPPKETENPDKGEGKAPEEPEKKPEDGGK
ncbi:MAG: hypothetical protein ABIH42_02245, partial [Planctomycetota bacterium]